MQHEAWRQEKPPVSAAVENAAGRAESNRGRTRGDAQEGAAAVMMLGSLFDGIGGWLLAARHAGVTPVWASEIEPFPYSVTAHHFPDVTQMGDITKIDGAAIPPVDIVCAGSPCQGLSLAGKRRGLDDERSGLFRRAIDIVRAMRRATGGRYPRFFVWENVPGAFNSNKGMDFRAVLEEIGWQMGDSRNGRTASV